MKIDDLIRFVHLNERINHSVRNPIHFNDKEWRAVKRLMKKVGHEADKDGGYTYMGSKLKYVRII